MKKRIRIASLLICVMMICAILMPAASASSPWSSYSFASISISGDQPDCDYGDGQMARVRNGMLSVSAATLENGVRGPVDVEIRLYNPHTNKWGTSYGGRTGSSGGFTVNFAKTDLPLSYGSRSYYTGYTNHYYDILDVYAYIKYDNNGGYSNPILLGHVYYLVSVA